MTLAEIRRAIESKRRVREIDTRERATFDYLLADLIGRSIARVYSSSNKMPSLAEAYPSLFSEEELEEKIQEKRDELSVLRFKQFAQSHNKNFGGVKESNE